MRYRVSHRTSYEYEAPVARSFHMLHLRPASTPTQVVHSHGLLIDPAPAQQDEVLDYYGNTTGLLCIDEEHRQFTVHARSIVDVAPRPTPELAMSSPWHLVAERARERDGRLAVDVLQYVVPSRQTPVMKDVRAFAEASFPKGLPVLLGAMDLTLRIFREFTFDPLATDVSTPISKVLASRRGVCQDFAHLTLAALRAHRIPARYVSGYLLTRPPPGQAKLRGVDASHAWVSVWAPESGWVDFDPTNGLIPRSEHITVAYGRDYDDISPISGVLLGGGGQTMAVSVDVDPIGEERI